MSTSELHSILQFLICEWENEVVEFKNVSSSYPTSDIGKYFSALSNEANLRSRDRAWLVFGIDNDTRQAAGSDYRPDHDQLHGLKHQIAQDSEPSITFREIHVLHHDGQRVVMFEIPPAPLGIPVAWKGHYYARAGESLTALGLDKLDAIRAQSSRTDWTAKIVPNARLNDLDPEAVAYARAAFAKKYANRFTDGEVAGWSDTTFLDRAKLTIDGRITRAALLLLGRTESTHFLTPHPAQLTWKLEGAEHAYEHFATPFLLNTGALYRKIRNIQMRILPEDQMIHVEVAKYDLKILLEALHNCIAHQDYTQNARVLVTEHIDRLIFENSGGFFDGLPQDYISGSKTPTRYRNPFLTQAMVELNMIDTMGYGIRDMYAGQAKRYFPLPDYDLSDSGVVRLTIYGKVVDPAYSRMLIQKTDLPLSDILALDRVQKHLTVDELTTRRLRKAGILEGRKPNLHITASIAAITGGKAQYIRTRKQDDDFYVKLVIDYIREFKSATRGEIDTLLMGKLSDALQKPQKLNKIRNLLTRMRAKAIISNQGSRNKPEWVLLKDSVASQPVKNCKKR